jgi:hypothetical protein
MTTNSNGENSTTPLAPAGGASRPASAAAGLMTPSVTHVCRWATEIDENFVYACSLWATAIAGSSSNTRRPPARFP